MAKLKLNPDPTFKATVAIPVAGSQPVPVEFTFKYRNKSAILAYREALANAPEDADEVQAFREFVLGWALEDAFTDDNIALFLESYPAAAGELFSAYVRESLGVRRGN